MDLLIEFLQFKKANEAQLHARYVLYDCNQPARLPGHRSGGTADYVNDTTITELGGLTAQMLGRGILMAKLKPSLIVSSPALRCVQTANALARACASTGQANVAIETSLYDWGGMYSRVPALLTTQELFEQRGIRVDPTYACLGPNVIARDEEDKIGERPTCGGVVNLEEKLSTYYQRVTRAVGYIANVAPSTGLTVIVGHASTMDAGPRALVGKPVTAPDSDEMDNMGIYYPYCGHIALARDKMSGSGKWSYVYSIVPPITYTGYGSHVDTQFHNRIAPGTVVAAIDANRHKFWTK